MRSIPKLTWVGLLFLVMTGLVFGQSFLGTITGVVLDPSGAVVPDAKVELTEITTNVQRTATTNAEGRYLFPDLTPGSYVVTVSRTGFKDIKSSPILLTAQQNARFDSTLEVGTGAEVVEVIATPPTLNTENATLTNVTPREDLVNLPLDRRSTLEFLFLSSSNTNGDGSSYMLGGLRGQYTNFTIDGVSSNATLWGGQSGPMTEESFEAISDMKVLTSNNSAEFPGVATLLISTRSGQNALHGSAQFTEHQYATDARCFFCGPNPSGPERHQLGGSIGGPVYLPKVYDGRNKTFFYFTWDSTIFPAGGGLWTSLTSVPTLAFKQGDFSKLGQPIIDPRTGKQFPGNIIPTDRISPVSQGLQKLGSHADRRHPGSRQTDAGIPGQPGPIGIRLRAGESVARRRPRLHVRHGETPARVVPQYRRQAAGYIGGTRRAGGLRRGGHHHHGHRRLYRTAGARHRGAASRWNGARQGEGRRAGEMLRGDHDWPPGRLPAGSGARQPGGR